MAKEKRNVGIYLSDHDRDCLTNYEFKKATEKVGLRIHPDKTKILSNQSTINSDTTKHIEVGDMSIEILTRNDSVKYWVRESRSTNKRHWKSRAGSEQLGRPSTNTDKN